MQGVFVGWAGVADQVRDGFDLSLLAMLSDNFRRCHSYFIPRSVRILGLFSPDAIIWWHAAQSLVMV